MLTTSSSLLTWRGMTVQLFPPPLLFCVYLIHFKTPYHHAKHYCGVTHDLEARLHAHRTGNGARLMEVIADNHIDWELSRLWPCATWEEARALERKLKKQHRPLLCPYCTGKPVDPLTQMRQGHWCFSLFERPGRRQPMSHAPVPCFVRRSD